MPVRQRPSPLESQAIWDLLRATASTLHFISRKLPQISWVCQIITELIIVSASTDDIFPYSKISAFNCLCVYFTISTAIHSYGWHCKSKSLLSWAVTNCLHPEKLSSSDKLLDLEIVLPTMYFIAHLTASKGLKLVGQPPNMFHVKTEGSTRWARAAFRDAGKQ